MNKVAIGALIVLISSSLIYTLIDNKPVNNDENKTKAQILYECLPKSDEGSRKKCLEILQSINSFEECREAGLPVMESYPMRCQTPEGKIFTQIIDEEEIRTSWINIEGEIGCLKSRFDGPQTLECRYGITTNEGTVYALNLNNEGESIGEIQVGEVVEVGGVMTPIEMISTNMWDKFGIEGIINVEEVRIISIEQP